MSQGILSPIWGSIRILLAVSRTSLNRNPVYFDIADCHKAAAEFGNYFDKIIDMLCQIENALTRFRLYEKLFQRHTRMLHTLSLVYFDIIEFCMQAREVFRRAEKNKQAWLGKRHSFTLLSPGSQQGLKALWKPFEQHFHGLMFRIQMHTSAADRDADISHMIEAAEARDLEKRSRAALDERLKEDRHKRLLSQLSRIEHRPKHRKICRARQQNSCGWILDSPEFNSWLDSTKSSHLWIHGIAGAGKTFGMAAAIDKIASVVEANGVLTYFYCDYLNADTLKATNIIGSLIKQLLLSTEITASIEERIKECFSHFESEDVVPDLSELEDLLKMVMKAFGRVFLAIDGLDECDPMEQRQIACVLKTLTQLSQPTAKLLVCSRQEVEIAKAFENGPRLRLTGQLNMDDISQYVEDTVTLRIDSGDLVIGDQSMKSEIIQTLAQGAKGMFLWVKLQLDEVCEAPDDHHRRQVLKELPRTLEETYARTLRKINASKSMRQVAQKIFRWIVCARRPLTHRELMEAIAHTAEDRCWNYSKIPQDPLLVGRACRNLVVKDEDEGTFSLAHYTVLQYLLSPTQEIALENFHFQRHMADEQIGGICIAYLLFTDFERQIEKFSDYKAAWRAAADDNMKRLEASTQVGLLNKGSSVKMLSKVARRLRGSQSPPFLDINYGHIFFPDSAPGPLNHSSIFSGYCLLDYVSENWIWHTASLGSSSLSWQGFKRLALQGQLLFDHRVWGDSHFSKDLPYRAMFIWAMEHGHGPLLKLLLNPPLGKPLKAYVAYENQHTRLDARVLHTLAIHGERQILGEIISGACSWEPTHHVSEAAADVLIAFQAEGSLEDLLRLKQPRIFSSFNSLLYIARILTWDVSTQAIMFALVAEEAQTAKALAASMGVSFGENVPGTSASWLLVAVLWQCSINILQVLVQCGARLQEDCGDGMTLLHISVLQESVDYVRYILSVGISPTAWDDTERSPIRIAIAKRSYLILQLLLAEPTLERLPGARFYSETYLHDAIDGFDVYSVRLLLEEGAGTGARDAQGNTPLLHLASRYATTFPTELSWRPLFDTLEEHFRALEQIFDLLIGYGAQTEVKSFAGGLYKGKGVYEIALTRKGEHDTKLLEKFKNRSYAPTFTRLSTRS
ncbi:MAG: hypothetical protein M1816_007233 [Peltula sp. TS41687]|nr:MAG: hypothetical protein M1816_007233 [Peltula sp. TS41687]